MIEPDLSGRSVLLVGTGRSRLPVLVRLLTAGAEVTVTGCADDLVAVHQDLSLLAAQNGLTPSTEWALLANRLLDLTYLEPFAAVTAVPKAALVVCVPRDDEEETFWADQCRRLGVLFRAERPLPAGVALVGGGPGARDLLTLGAVAELRGADVVFADRLGPAAVLAELAPGALVVDVGKDPGHHRVPQERIEELLVAFGQSGYRVARLKGGDPYVFGRGGEERRTLLENVVPVTVRPGISSAISVPAAADIPVTCRQVSTSFTVLSGHQVPEDSVLEGLVKVGGTLVVLMGVGTLPPLLAGLRRAGLPADTPAAVVENGYASDQRVFTGTAANLVELAAVHKVRSPAVFVIGEVVRLRDELLEVATAARIRLDPEPPLAPEVHGGSGVRSTSTRGTSADTGDAEAPGTSADSSPEVVAATVPDSVDLSAFETPEMHTELSGFTIGITASRRATDQANAFLRRGAQVITAPTLAITPTEGDTELLTETALVIENPPDLLLVTTGHGLNGWFEAAEAAGMGEDLRSALTGTTILVRGAKARGAVRAQGFSDAGISADDSTTSLVDVALAHGVGGKRVAIQQHGVVDHAQMARLVAAGADLVTIRPYRWVKPEDPKAVSTLMASVIRHHVDVLTFTSAPAAEALLTTAKEEGLYELLLEAMRTEVTCVAVGPVTAAPLVAAGIEPLMPERHRLGSMIRVVVDHLNDHAIDQAQTRCGAVALRGVELLIGGERLTLPPHLADLLRVLVQADGDVVTRASLRRALPAGPSDHAIDMAISRLRKIIAPHNLVVTVPKRGFKLASV